MKRYYPKYLNRKCVICGKKFCAISKKNRRKTCSDDCRRKRNNIMKRFWNKEHLFKHNLSSSKAQNKKNWKKLPTEKLLERLHYQLQNIDIIENILKKRKVYLE